MVRPRRSLIALTIILVMGGVLFWAPPVRWAWHYLVNPWRASHGMGRTTDGVVRDLGPRLRPGLKKQFEASKVAYPPAQMTFLVLKEEKRLEVWCPDRAGHQKRIMSFSILAASGRSGPKLKQGDCQVPEGKYRLVGFNPNSRFHLSMKINYPNAFDRKMAALEHRSNLGGDIFIHGSAVSIGCLAMGDANIEKLFLMVADTGMSKVKVIILPWDFRLKAPVDHAGEKTWVRQLYQGLARESQTYKQN